MSTQARFSSGIAGLALSATLAIACNGALDFGNRNLTSDPPRPPAPQPDPVGYMPIQQHDAGADDAATRTCPPAMVDVTKVDYPAMCRHYCDTLEETTRYLLLSRGETPGDAGTVSDECYELRCVPRCVDQALCLTQCDADQTQYVAVCANPDAGAADDALCPSSPDDHLAACRDGCNPPAPRIDLP